MLTQLLLFAQEGSPFAGNRPDPALIVITFCIAGAVIAVGCTYFGCKHASKQRELEHIERLKAIEMGQDPDAHDEEKKYRNGVFWISFWIGFFVPLVATAGATAATMEANLSSFTLFAIWSAVAVIGVAGVASAAWLMHSCGARLGFNPKREPTGAMAYQAR
jgi:hypothetical protein